MPWAVAVAAVAGLATSAIGAQQAGEKRAAAASATENAINEIKSVGAPPDLSREILFKHYEQAGILTPELEHQINMEFSKVAQIAEDPRFKNMQIDALEATKAASKTGLTPEDRLAFNQMRAKVQQEAESKRQQILQSRQARGIAGGGDELAAQLSASQAGDTEAAAAADRIAADAANRRAAAVQALGTMSTQMRGQDFDIERSKASAADELAKFNIQNQIAQQSRNIAAKNEAARMNLAEKQRVQDVNTQMANAELIRQQEAKRQYWLDQANQSQRLANAWQGQASQLTKDAEGTASQWQNIGTGIGGLASGYANYAQKDKEIERKYPKDDEEV